MYVSSENKKGKRGQSYKQDKGWKFWPFLGHYIIPILSFVFFHRLDDLFNTCKIVTVKNKQFFFGYTLQSHLLMLVNALKGLHTLMWFQTRKTLIHPQNTNEGVFDEIWDLSVPPLMATQLPLSSPRKVVTTSVKVVHVTPVVLLQLYSMMWHECFVCAINKNNLPF